MAGTTFKVAAIFQAFDKMSGPIKNINSRLNQFSKKMNVVQASAKKSAFSVGGSFKSIAAGIIGASVAFAIWDKGIIGTIRRGAELEATLVQAGAKFGTLANVVPGSEAFKKLESAALHAGLTTEFTANQTANSLKVLAQAGLGLEQSISTLPQVIDFATASGLDLERATSISADAIGSFGSNIKDLNPAQLKSKMAEINDIMVITANSFNTSVEQMFEASTKGGRVLTRLIGASGFEFAAFVGQVANTGLKAEVAGTGLRAGFIRMASGVPEVNKAMRKLGVRMTDNTGKMRGVADILEDVRTGMAKVKDEGKKLALFQKLFGRVGINVMEALQSRTKEQFLETVKAMEAQRGEVQRIAKVVRATLTGVWIKFLSRMEGLGLILFNKVAPGLKTVVIFLNQFATAMSISADPMIQLVSLMGQLAIAMNITKISMVLLNAVLNRSPLFFLGTTLLGLTFIFPDAAKEVLNYTEVMSALIKAITAAVIVVKIWNFLTVRSVFLAQLAAVNFTLLGVAQGIYAIGAWLATAATTAFAIAMAILTSPITLVIAGIVALVAGIIWMITHFDQVKEFFSGNWFSILMLLNPFTAFLAILGKIFPDSIGKIISKAKNMFVSAFSSIADFFGFGDDEREIDVNKTSNVNVDGGIGDITPSPSTVAAAEINGRILVDFKNKPADVDVSQPDIGSNDDGLIILGSGA